MPHTLLPGSAPLSGSTACSEHPSCTHPTGKVYNIDSLTRKRNGVVSTDWPSAAKSIHLAHLSEQYDQRPVDLRHQDPTYEAHIISQHCSPLANTALSAIDLWNLGHAVQGSMGLGLTMVGEGALRGVTPHAEHLDLLERAHSAARPVIMRLHAELGSHGSEGWADDVISQQSRLDSSDLRDQKLMDDLQALNFSEQDDSDDGTVEKLERSLNEAYRGTHLADTPGETVLSALMQLGSLPLDGDRVEQLQGAQTCEPCDQEAARQTLRQYLGWGSEPSQTDWSTVAADLNHKRAWHDTDDRYDHFAKTHLDDTARLADQAAYIFGVANFLNSNGQGMTDAALLARCAATLGERLLDSEPAAAILSSEDAELLGCLDKAITAAQDTAESTGDLGDRSIRHSMRDCLALALYLTEPSRQGTLIERAERVTNSSQ